MSINKVGLNLNSLNLNSTQKIQDNRKSYFNAPVSMQGKSGQGFFTWLIELFAPVGEAMKHWMGGASL